MNGISPYLTSHALSPSRSTDDQLDQLIDTANMEAKIYWGNTEKTIIRYTFQGVWDWDDFYQILERRARLTLVRDVDVIIDFRGIMSPPSDAILHLKRAAKMAEVRNSIIVIISNSATIATLYQAFVAMYKSLGKRVRIVNSDEEAYALLDALRKKRG